MRKISTSKGCRSIRSVDRGLRPNASETCLPAPTNFPLGEDQLSSAIWLVLTLRIRSCLTEFGIQKPEFRIDSYRLTKTESRMEIPVSNLRSVNTCLHRRSKSAHECHSADEQMEAFRRKVAALIMERVRERGAPREPPTVNYQLLTLQLVSGTGVIRS